jgi:SSS family solute:Na+ symporter
VTNPIGVSWIGIVFGLGFVLAFGTGRRTSPRCSARSRPRISPRPAHAADRRDPEALHPGDHDHPGPGRAGHGPRLGGKGNLEYNNAIPLLMNEFLPNGMLGVALAGLLAAFMAGVAANVSAFNTVVTYDLWEPYVRPARATVTT